MAAVGAVKAHERGEAMAYETLVTFQRNTDAEGGEHIRVIHGGQHRGGVTQGVQSYTGGLSVQKARILGEWMGQTAMLALAEHVQEALEL
jgi:hypothetical protein